MPNCFVPKCSAKDHLFRIPKPITDDLVRQWRVNIRRADVTFDPNNKNHCVCHKHFDTSFVKSHDSFIINSELVKLERKCWTLEPGAVPTIFPHLPKYYQKKAPIKRRIILKKSAGTGSTKKKSKTDKETTLHTGGFPVNNQLTAPESTNSTTDESINQLIKDEPYDFPDISNDIIKQARHFWPLQELTDWKYDFVVHKFEPQLLVYKLNLDDEVVRIDRLVKINSNGKFVGQIEHMDVTDNLVLDSSIITSFEVLELLIKKLEELKICKGLPGFQAIETHRGATKVGDVYFSGKCPKINTSVVCTACKLLGLQLTKKVYQLRVNRNK